MSDDNISGYILGALLVGGGLYFLGSVNLYIPIGTFLLLAGIDLFKYIRKE